VDRGEFTPQEVEFARSKGLVPMETSLMCHSELVSESQEMLKQVQHDILDAALVAASAILYEYGELG